MNLFSRDKHLILLFGLSIFQYYYNNYYQRLAIKNHINSNSYKFTISILNKIDNYKNCEFTLLKVIDSNVNLTYILNSSENDKLGVYYTNILKIN